MFDWVQQSNDWCSIGFDCRTVRLDRSGKLKALVPWKTYIPHLSPVSRSMKHLASKVPRNCRAGNYNLKASWSRRLNKFWTEEKREGAAKRWQGVAERRGEREKDRYREILGLVKTRTSGAPQSKIRTDVLGTKVSFMTCFSCKRQAFFLGHIPQVRIQVTMLQICKQDQKCLLALILIHIDVFNRRKSIWFS